MAFRWEPLIWILLGAVFIFRPISSIRVIMILTGFAIGVWGIIALFQLNRSTFSNMNMNTMNNMNSMTFAPPFGNYTLFPQFSGMAK